MRPGAATRAEATTNCELTSPDAALRACIESKPEIICRLLRRRWSAS